MQLLGNQKPVNVLGGVEPEKGTLPDYPADHQVGMEVPEGGSNCDKCEYLKAKQTCGQPQYVEWNGSDKIPVKTSKYCCDFFDIADKDAAHKAAKKQVGRLNRRENPEADPDLQDE